MSDAKTLVQAWLDRCRSTPSQTALRHKCRGIWRSVSWQEYRDAVLRIAQALERLGLGKGAVVSIVSESRPEWLYVDMAAQASGCVSHGVYPTCAAPRTSQQLALAGTDIVFVEDAWQASKILQAGQVPAALRAIVVFDTRGLRELRSDQVMSLADFMGDPVIDDAAIRRFEQRAASVGEEDVAFLCATAGSVGAARLAAITHACALRRAQTLRVAFDVRAQDRTLCFVPLANAAERMFSAVLPLQMDVRVYFPESSATVANDLREVQPDWVHAPARFWERLLARTESAAMLASPLARRLYARSVDVASTGWTSDVSRRHLLRSMGLARARAGYSGGAAVAPALHHWFQAMGLRLWDVYESAETCGPALRLPLAGAVGDAELQTEVRIGADDELMLRPAALFSGYWVNKTLTAPASTPEGWLATGDVVRAESDGLRVAGRLAHRFHTQDGRHVLPEAIERELHANPYIASAVVMRADDGRCAGLLGLEMESILCFAQTQAIPFVDFSHLVRSEPIRTLLQKQVDALNRQLEDGQRIDRFSLLAESPSPGGEDMTPALRARRSLLIERFEAEARVLNEADAAVPRDRELSSRASVEAV